MPHANAALIHRLYAALAARDAAAMAACYDDDARFCDPVFGELDADEVRAMWRLLCARAGDLAVNVDAVEANEAGGQARWTADYTFSRTGRRVHNVITARYRFRDGKILTHHDHFSLWRWSGMALGIRGWLLGWTPWMRNAIRAEARRGLGATDRPPR